VTASLDDIITRLTAVIQEENRILAEDREKSLESLIQKKSQLLLELLRIQKALGDMPRTDLKRQLESLRAVMEANQRLLSIHLSAAREISETILEALRQNDSDGTYEGRLAVNGLL
jgi:cytosine/adenosine deaminase-related metal-dependent hydrolase